MISTRQKVVRLHLKGQTNGQIAAALSLSRGTVGGHLKRWRRERAMHGQGVWWTDEKLATVCRMHAEGKTSAECGEAVGRSSEAVRKRGRALGLSWIDRMPGANTNITAPSLNEKQAEEALRQGDARLVRALALAIQRGDHLPQTARAS